MSRIEKLQSQESIWNVSSMLYCSQNCCQWFLREKTLLREEFWGLSFEDVKRMTWIFQEGYL